MLKVTAEVRRGIRRGTLSAVLGLGALGGGRAYPPPAAAPPAAETLSPGARRAYAELLKLRVAACRQLLAAEPAGAPGTLLVADCADFVELLSSQDAGRYAATAAAQEARLAALARGPAGPWHDYALAEIRLHQALAQLVFHHEVRGAWNLRQTVLLTQAAAGRYPGFLPLRKTLGLCQFGIGSLPAGYHWFLRLLGLSGSVEAGLQHLSRAAAQPHDFQTESRILLALIREAYYQQDDQSLALVSRLAAEQPDNLLFSYLVISLRKRQHQGEAALAAYRARPTGPAYLPLTYLHHLAADLLLYRGDYAGSTAENQQFLREYRGEYYRKDAAFKLYLAPPGWAARRPPPPNTTASKSTSPARSPLRKTLTPSAFTTTRSRSTQPSPAPACSPTAATTGRRWGCCSSFSSRPPPPPATAWRPPTGGPACGRAWAAPIRPASTTSARCAARPRWASPRITSPRRRPCSSATWPWRRGSGRRRESILSRPSPTPTTSIRTAPTRKPSWLCAGCNANAATGFCHSVICQP